MAPVATFMLSLVAWAVVPFDYGMVLSDPNIGLLYLFAISSLGVYGIIIAGWSSKTGGGLPSPMGIVNPSVIVFLSGMGSRLVFVGPELEVAETIFVHSSRVF
ncbi:hypothetical protein ZWY2020_004975 [Hordeum vulgare]|nr:hypothetical protein ZWY2020_004975 [Hordeum vulgare]